MTAFLLAAAVTAAYLAAVAGLRRRGDRWPAARSLLWGAAAACVPLAAALPEALGLAGLRAHVLQHVLLAMVLPVAAALAAPATLALRTLRGRRRRALLALLHSRWARVVTSAPVVVVLEVSGFAVFFLTPLHHALAGRPVLTLLVHLHAVLAGYLFAALLLGRDPVRVRRSVTTRLVVLLLVAGSHDTIAKLLHASPPAGSAPGDAQAAARLLFGAGTVLDVVLAVLVLSGWYAAGSRQLARERRRSAQAPRSPKTAVSPRAT
nr:cytochrome c oxidase assembly protein [Kineococcus siccus]